MSRFDGTAVERLLRPAVVVPVAIATSVIAGLLDPVLLAVAGMLVPALLTWRFGLRAGVPVHLVNGLLLLARFTTTPPPQAGPSGAPGLPGQAVVTVVMWLVILAVNVLVGRLSSVSRQLRVRLARERELLAEVADRDATLRRTVDVLPVWIWTTDRDLRFTSMLGAPMLRIGAAGESVDASVTDVLEDQGQARSVLAAFEAALAGETVDVTATFGSRTLDAQIAPALGPDGTIVGTVGVALDVTARAEAEAALTTALERERAAVERLRELDGMKDAFLVAVSHELRTPVTAVRGFTHALRASYQRLDQDKLGALLERLDVAARRLEDLLGDILDVQYLDRTSDRVARRACGLHDLVADVVAEQQSDRITLALEPVTAAVDASQVARLVGHLVGNAVRFTPEGTPLTVRLQRRPDHAELRVEQAGVGLPAEYRERIFEPFQRGPGRVEHSPGTGVGLTVVRRVVDAHGGSIDIEDLDDGGVAFRVRLPLALSRSPIAA